MSFDHHSEFVVVGEATVPRIQPQREHFLRPELRPRQLVTANRTGQFRVRLPGHPQFRFKCAQLTDQIRSFSAEGEPQRDRPLLRLAAQGRWYTGAIAATIEIANVTM